MLTLGFVVPDVPLARQAALAVFSGARARTGRKRRQLDQGGFVEPGRGPILAEQAAKLVADNVTIAE
jgi:hypothetical protein